MLLFKFHDVTSISTSTQTAPETKKHFNYKIHTMFFLVLEDHPVWSGALSALMGSERLPQLGPGARPAWRVGGGSLKGIKTSPTKQIQGYIIQTAEMFSCCHQQIFITASKGN